MEVLHKDKHKKHYMIRVKTRHPINDAAGNGIGMSVKTKWRKMPRRPTQEFDRKLMRKLAKNIVVSVLNQGSINIQRFGQVMHQAARTMTPLQAGTLMHEAIEKAHSEKSLIELYGGTPNGKKET